MERMVMTNPENNRQDQAVDAANKLAEQFKAMNEQVAKLPMIERREKHTRHIVIGLVVSIVLDLLLSASFFYNQIVSHDESVSQCRVANVARYQDRALWAAELQWESTVNKFNRTQRAADEDRIRKLVAADEDRIRKLVAAKDRPHDCARVYSTIFSR
jgi:hypothetical protein